MINPDSGTLIVRIKRIRIQERKMFGLSESGFKNGNCTNQDDPDSKRYQSHNKLRAK